MNKLEALKIVIGLIEDNEQFNNYYHNDPIEIEIWAVENVLELNNLGSYRDKTQIELNNVREKYGKEINEEYDRLLSVFNYEESKYNFIKAVLTNMLNDELINIKKDNV